MKRRALIGGGLIIAILVGWLLTTKNLAVSPFRNFAEYHLFTRWWNLTGKFPQGDEENALLQGTVSNEAGQPIAGAWIHVARWDGKSYAVQSGEDGSYEIAALPAGKYVIATGAPGYHNQLIGSKARRVNVKANQPTEVNITLQAAPPPLVEPGSDFQLSDMKQASCNAPLESTAIRHTVKFDNLGAENNLTYFYTPLTATETSALPILFVIYPGPVESWECASLPLAQAGYGVIALGPQYTLDIDKNLDEVERLRQFAVQGKFPGLNPNKIGLLGGSYSSLHVMRLLQRQPEVYTTAVLLGPPTDLFRLRYQLEYDLVSPPFGLDKVALAFGFPDREPGLFWKYSGAYHVRPDWPPMLIIHSRSDEIVPFEQTALLTAQLEAHGVPYQTHLVDGASHYLLSDTGDGQAIYNFALDYLAEQFETGD